MKKLLLLLLPLCAFGQQKFDIEGHRGARGLYPENTIVAFTQALKLGVNTLEMDVVVTADSQLVISHDPTVNCEICDYCSGKDKKESRLYRLPYSVIKTIDCGSKGNSKFPEQQKVYAVKPLLKEVIDTIEKSIKDNKLPEVYYNIETKSTPEGDNDLHPVPAIFAKMLYDVVKQKGILKRVIIQSFDVRTLQEIKKIDSSVTTALLVLDADGIVKNIKQLGYTPEIYSPNYVLVNKKVVQYCHKHHIRIIPWTVNDEDKMRKLKALGVDGIITDYPDRAIKTLR